MNAANVTNETVSPFPDVNITAMTDIHALKGAHGDAFFWWLIIAAAIFVVVVYAMWVRRARTAMTESRVPKETPLDRARRELGLLAARLAAEGADAKFFVGLSAILRQYIEGRFSVRANEMTSEEFIAFVKDATFVSGKHKNLLKEFFGLADLVKFAKQDVTLQSAEASLASVRSFVDETAPKNETETESDL